MMDPKKSVDGVLLVDKKSGLTSHDVVEKFRRRSKVKKAGHTGTLDPLATGLLVLCVGKATRLQAYLMGMEKTYEGTIQFGWATDSYDAAGTPAGEAVERDVSAVDFEPHVARFRGEIEQMPPAFSAKKIDGVRAYELARKGAEVKLQPKRVTVYEFTILGVDGSCVRFRVRSSAGTYMRSLAHDLGQSIGVPAHLKELRRTAIGNFAIGEAISYDQMAEATPEKILAAPHFQSLAEIDLPLERLRIDWAQQGKLMQGQAVIMVPAVAVHKGDLLALGNPHDQLVAIGEVVNVLREGGPVEVRPKVVLAG
ncbi:MAG TPA: tRNA pseudouridine(55) synthase TruB [Thermoanaerobaculia bacterium]|jgi:tRNA pseudouridine55 synthase|nr:tRNA pseudouridine(55) synthase TruB [Thermoanaerobaculia bacterium]